MQILKYCFASFCLSLLSLNTAIAANVPDNNTAFFNIEHWKTSQQANVYFVPIHNLPMVNVEIMIDAGSARDGNQPGIAALTNQLLGQNSQSKDADAIANSFADVAAQFSQSIDRDYAKLSLQSLSDPHQLQPAIDNLHLLLAEPQFAGNSFDRTKNQQLQNLLAEQQSPDAIATNQFFATLYGNHPYAHDPLGDSQAVANYTPTDVLAFYQQYYVASNMTLVIVGDISAQTAKAISTTLLSHIPQGQAATALEKPVYQPDQFRVNIPFPSSQNEIRIGELGTAINNPDLPALTVGNYILGGGVLVSRLFNEVRNKRGLTYHITSEYQPMQTTGPFIVSAQSKTQSSDTTISLIINEINQFLTQGPSNTEIAAAKTNIIESFPLRFDSNQHIADMVAQLGFYHLPLNYFQTYQGNIEKVSNQDVVLAFNQHLNPTELLTIDVGTIPS